MAGNTPLYVLKKIVIRPKNDCWEPSGLDEKQACEVEGDEKEVSFGGEQGDRLKAATEGNQFLKKIIDPRLPSQKDVEEHNLTHLLYRN